MHTYKTKDGSDQVIPNIGATVNSMIITEVVIENPNFELVESNDEQHPQAQLPINEPPAPEQPPIEQETTTPKTNESQENNEQ